MVKKSLDGVLYEEGEIGVNVLYFLTRLNTFIWFLNVCNILILVLFYGMFTNSLALWMRSQQQQVVLFKCFSPIYKGLHLSIQSMPVVYIYVYCWSFALTQLLLMDSKVYYKINFVQPWNYVSGPANICVGEPATYISGFPKLQNMSCWIRGKWCTKFCLNIFYLM